MISGKWYTIDEVAMFLFGELASKSSIGLKYYNAWEHEFFFEKNEIESIKNKIMEIDKMSNEEKPIAYKTRELHGIVVKKQNGKSRKKRLMSIKFIMGEI